MTVRLRKPLLKRDRPQLLGAKKNFNAPPASAPPQCSLQSQCQACVFVNMPYEQGLKAKYQAGLDLLSGELGLNQTKLLAPVPSPKQLYYRASAKLAVAPSLSSDRLDGKRFRIGLYKPNSHDVIDIGRCPLHVASIKQVLEILQDELEASSLAPWHERTASGDIRYIVMRASHLTSEVMLTFVVTNLECRSALKQIITNVRQRQQRVVSVYLNLQAGSGNAIFGNETIHLAGQKFLRESLCGLRFEISPTSFFQVNPWQAQNLFRRIEQLVGMSQSGVAWDLYCGSGPIAMILARAGFRVLGIEENPSCIQDAEANLRRNKLETAVTLVSGATETVLQDIPEWGQRPQVIVTNPARSGLAPKAREALITVLNRHPSCQLIYVSCEMKTLARDLKALASSGFVLRQLEAFDMFAQTDKMEWLAVLTKG